MPKMTEEVKSFKCNWCGELYKSYVDAAECAYRHARKNYANALLDCGYNLDFINQMCGFGWELSDEIKKVTKDNCFIIPRLQCCNKPAYRIVEIDEDGRVYLYGWGSWDGSYGESILPSGLPEPYPKEELFVHE